MRVQHNDANHENHRKATTRTSVKHRTVSRRRDNAGRCVSYSKRPTCSYGTSKDLLMLDVLSFVERRSGCREWDDHILVFLFEGHFLALASRTADTSTNLLQLQVLRLPVQVISCNVLCIGCLDRPTRLDSTRLDSTRLDSTRERRPAVSIRD
jgi:hypothetical protein